LPLVATHKGEHRVDVAGFGAAATVIPAWDTCDAEGAVLLLLPQAVIEQKRNGTKKRGGKLRGRTIIFESGILKEFS
jgi:hypothetical protein